MALGTTYFWKNKTEQPIEYKGVKNQKGFEDFTDLCKKSQSELKEFVTGCLQTAGYEVIVENGFVYAKGNLPVLLTAHLDTVHKTPVETFYVNEYADGTHGIASPEGIGGDDRCGVYIILEIIKTLKPSILFCENEESGGIGSNLFCKTEYLKELSDLHYFIELDRANADDAVFYDCDNEEFTEWVLNTTGYNQEYGSFSDISHLSPASKVASVNLSCGYYNAHTKCEYVIYEEMLTTLEITRKMLKTESKPFEYIEKVYRYPSYYGYGNWNRSFYGDFGSYNDGPHEEDDYASALLVIVYLHNGQECEWESSSIDFNEGLVEFFMEHPSACFNDIVDYYYF